MAKRSDTIVMSVGAALLGVIGGAAPTKLLVAEAEAQVLQPAARRRDEQPEPEDVLLVVAPRDESATLLAYHSSHRSHSSHSSHYSGGGGSRRSYDYGYVPDVAPEPVYVPPPHRAKPAVVSLVAYPGGHIFVDGKSVGRDATAPLRLSAGSHEVRIENRFLGQGTVTIDLAEGQTGVVEVEW